MKIKMLVVCLLAIACVIFTVYMPKPTPSSDIIEITAIDIWHEFDNDRGGATQKYDGKTIALTGEVSEIAESYMGYPCILLDHGADSIPTGIFCFFPTESTDVVLNVNIGETVTIQGVCSIPIHIAGEYAPFITIKDSSLI